MSYKYNNYRSVLIVEDDAIDQMLHKTALKKSLPDVDIFQAYNGQEALDFLQECNVLPDVILLDINMPQMDGHEFLTEFSKRYRGIPPVVIMLTGSDDKRDRNKVMRHMHVIDFVQKPISQNYVKSISYLQAA